MTSLNTPLEEFNNKLNDLKPLFEEKLNTIENKSRKIIETDKNIKALIKSHGNTKVTVEISGKIFTTKLKNFLSIRDSFFYKFIANELDEGKTGDSITTRWYFDRSNCYFSCVLDYLRTGVLNYDYMPKNVMINLEKELEFYGIWPALNLIKGFCSTVEIVAFTSSGKFQNAGKHTLEGIQEKNGKGGICVQSPYEIIFELNTVHEIQNISIRGWTENTGIWSGTNGENAVISVSEDKSKWETVGKIPPGFGSEIKTVKFQTQHAKYVKFKHNSYLGIGFIDFGKV
jgi:hypothetical protein